MHYNEHAAAYCSGVLTGPGSNLQNGFVPCWAFDSSFTFTWEFTIKFQEFGNKKII